MNTNQIRFFSIFYISIPNFIFVLGWLNLAIAIPTSICMILALYFSHKKIQSDEYTHHTEFISPKTIAWLFLWALFCSIISGVGGFCLQVIDYDKHNILFNNLALRKWPILYNSTDFLCYYFAYYLPGGLWAKLCGINFLSYFILLWNSIGLLFIFLNIATFFETKYKILVIVIVTLFLPLTIHTRSLLDLDYSKNYISFLNDFLSFLYFAPQRFIGTIIILFYLLFEWEYTNTNKNLYVLSLGLLWNPLAVLVYLAFVVFYLIKTKFNDILSFQNFLTVPFLICIIAFFLAHKPVNEFSFYFTNHSFMGMVIEFCFFILIECNILLLLFLFFTIKIYSKSFKLKNTYTRPILLLLLSIISIIPIKFGFFNDLSWSTYGNLMIFVNSFIIVNAISLFSVANKLSKWIIIVLILLGILPNILCQIKIIKYNIAYDNIANDKNADFTFGHIHNNQMTIMNLKTMKTPNDLLNGMVYHQYK